ncbi:MAG: hypothetical protein Kow00121_34350 [Elainellaceae cyanobacterium]
MPPLSSVSCFLFTSTDKTSRSRFVFWICLSLTVAIVLAIPALQEAFSHKYVVQDDARQHVFWMSRFIDPELFSQDLIADYFQSVAPWGYSSFYFLFTTVGIEPLLLHKLLPMGLAVLTTIYAFGTTLELLPIPFAGFLTALFLNQVLWMRDDIVSATPVAFVYPLFFAFLYYLLRQAIFPCLVTIALQALFYPQCVFIYAGVLLLRLIEWEGGPLTLSRNRHNYRLVGMGLAVAVLVMLPYALKSSPYGPILSRAEAHTLWTDFFSKDFTHFWFCDRRSGLLPSEWCRIDYDLPVLENAGVLTRLLGLPPIWFTLALPFLFKVPDRFPLVHQINRNRILVLPQILLISVSFFLIAHALLFQLHLPNRYSEHSFRVIIVLAAGVSLTVILEALLRFSAISQPSNLFRLAIATVLGLFLLLYPVELNPFLITNYVRERQYPELYDFFAQQPKDSLIASIASDVDNIPSFSQRSILVGDSYVLLYHLGYYRQMRQRVIDLIEAQYSPDLQQVQQFIQTYGVDFWLLENLSFQPSYFRSNSIFKEFPEVKEFPDVVGAAKAQAQQGNSALAILANDCRVFQSDKFIVVSADCLLKQS